MDKPTRKITYRADREYPAKPNDYRKQKAVEILPEEASRVGSSESKWKDSYPTTGRMKI